MNRYIEELAKDKGWLLPRYYPCTDVKQIEELVNNLPNLEEGVVLYDTEGTPVLKVKSKAYLASHHLRGEGLNPKRCMDLVIMNETDEYLTVFPEDVSMLQPYINAYDTLWDSIAWSWGKHRDIETRKGFALSVKDLPHSSILFSMRNGLTRKQAWDKLTQNSKYNLITQFLE